MRSLTAQLRHLARARAPQVHAAAQPHGQHVGRAPVDQIEVKVVLERRRVENLEGNLGDLPGGGEVEASHQGRLRLAQLACHRGGAPAESCDAREGSVFLSVVWGRGRARRNVNGVRCAVRGAEGENVPLVLGFTLTLTMMLLLMLMLMMVVHVHVHVHACGVEIAYCFSPGHPLTSNCPAGAAIRAVRAITIIISWNWIWTWGSIAEKFGPKQGRQQQSAVVHPRIGSLRARVVGLVGSFRPVATVAVAVVARIVVAQNTALQNVLVPVGIYH